MACKRAVSSNPRAALKLGMRKVCAVVLTSMPRCNLPPLAVHPRFPVFIKIVFELLDTVTSCLLLSSIYCLSPGLPFPPASFPHPCSMFVLFHLVPSLVHHLPLFLPPQRRQKTGFARTRPSTWLGLLFAWRCRLEHVHTAAIQAQTARIYIVLCNYYYMFCL
jgi:hypothetical protein